MKKLFAAVALLLALFTAGAAFAEEAPVYDIDADHADMVTFGNIYVSCPTEEILRRFDYGDMLLATVEGKEPIAVPLCGEFDDVSPGECVLRAKAGKEHIVLAVNYGQMGVRLGLLEPAPEGSAVKFTVTEGAFPRKISFTLLEKGGYKERLAIGKLGESAERAAYPALTDRQFANFREVCCGTIRRGVLFRSSSPVDPQMGRNAFADAALEECGIVSVLNMTDTRAEAEAFPGFAGTNYAARNVDYHKMSITLGTSAFDGDIAACLRFFLNNEAPYLVHCVVGKDRTGFLCAVTEALCGASLEEILSDYAETYINLYDVREGTQQAIPEETLAEIRNLLVRNLSYAYGVEVNAENINAETEAYVRRIGLTDGEIAALREKLS